MLHVPRITRPSKATGSPSARRNWCSSSISAGSWRERLENSSTNSSPPSRTTSSSPRQRIAHAGGELAQQLVAPGMAEAVIDLP